jgi:hypothetical protein
VLTSLIGVITSSAFTRFFIILSVVRLSPLGTAATTGLRVLYQPQVLDDGECGAIGGMKIGRGNRSTRGKPAPAPLCPPQIPHDQTPGSNPGRRSGKPATNRLSHFMCLSHHSATADPTQCHALNWIRCSNIAQTDIRTQQPMRFCVTNIETMALVNKAS